MDVVRTIGDPILKEGEIYCADAETEYYAYCGNYWPEFHDEGAFIYSTVAMCGYKELLSAGDRAEAEALVLQKNESGCACPACHMAGKWKAMTGIEILEEKRVIENVMNRDISLQR